MLSAVRAVICAFHRSAIVASVAMLVVSAGCSDNLAAPSLLPADQLFWRLTLNHHAVTLSLTPGTDTVQLVATPLTVSGDTLHATPASPVTFSVVSSDTSVQVSALGLVTAHSVKSLVRIAATQTIGGVALADTVTLRVNAVATVPQLKTLSIHPVAGQDTVLNDASGQFPVTLPVRVMDLNNISIPYLPTTATAVVANAVLVHFRSADTLVAKITSTAVGTMVTTTVTGVSAGHVWVYAECDAYGVTRRDSLLVKVSIPRVATVNVLARTPIGSTTPVSDFNAKTVTIAAGGAVAWFNGSGQPVDIVFDDSTHVAAAPFAFKVAFLPIPATSAAGNIPAFASSASSLLITANATNTRTRGFPIAGTYPYHSTLYGTTGTVVVVP